LTIITCYSTSIVVIYLNLPASMRLFILIELAFGSHMVFVRPSVVNSYKTTLHYLNYV